MKRLIFVFMLFAIGISAAKADQLAWLAKEDAENGAAVIKSAGTVYLFCGCCDKDILKRATVVDVKVKYTGTESYYELILQYTDDNRKLQSEAIDLAYVWVKTNTGNSTVGREIGLEHDPCSDGNFALPGSNSASGSSWDGEYVFTAMDWYNSSYALDIFTNDAVTNAILTVSGKEIFYKMSCIVQVVGNDLIIRFYDVIEGEYWEREKLVDQYGATGAHPELFRLKRNSANKISTVWDQLSVPDDTRNANGSVMFEKIK